MKQHIEDMLRPIVVEPLSDMWRYPGCQYFEFGVQRPHKNRKGQDVTWSDWHLGVECDWRITGPAGYIVSSDDYGPGYNRRDEMAHPFFDMLHDDPPIVEAIDADEQGGLCIRMSRGYTLEIQPVDWPLDEDQWRFWCDANAEEYFVVTRGGIQNRLIKFPMVSNANPILTPPGGVEPPCVRLPFHLVRSQSGYDGI